MSTEIKKRLAMVWVSAVVLLGSLSLLSGCATPIVHAYPGEPRPLDQVGFLVEGKTPTAHKVGMLQVEDMTLIDTIDGVKPDRPGKGTPKFALLPGKHVVVAYMPGFMRTLVIVAQDGPSYLRSDVRTRWYVQLAGAGVVPLELDDERINATQEKLRVQTERTVTFSVEAGVTYMLRGKFTADNELSPAGIWVERLD